MHRRGARQINIPGDERNEAIESLLSFRGREQELVNGGAHAEHAVQHDAQQEQPGGSPCKRGARIIRNYVSANESHNDIHDRNAADTNGVHALARNTECIPVFAQAVHLLNPMNVMLYMMYV